MFDTTRLSAVLEVLPKQDKLTSLAAIEMLYGSGMRYQILATTDDKMREILDSPTLTHDELHDLRIGAIEKCHGEYMKAMALLRN